MPYNVIDQSRDRAERIYCETAAKALSQHKSWNDAGRAGLRVVSVEGTEISIERLTVLAEFEREASSLRRPAA